MPHNRKYITLFIISLLPIFFFCGNSGCESGTIRKNNPSEENNFLSHSIANKTDTPLTNVRGIDGEWYYESRVPYGDSIYITYSSAVFFEDVKHWSYRIAASDTSNVFIGIGGDSYKTSRVEKGDSMWFTYHNLATHKDSSVHYALSDVIPKPLNIKLSKDSVDLGWWVESRYTLPRDLYWGERFWSTYMVNGKEERIPSNEGVRVRHFFIKDKTLYYTPCNMNQDSVWTKYRDQEAFKYTYTIQKNGGTYFGDTYKTKTGAIGFNEKFCFSAKDSSLQYVNNAWWSVKFERKINIASVYKQFHEYVNRFKNADTNTFGWYRFFNDPNSIYRLFKQKDDTFLVYYYVKEPIFNKVKLFNDFGDKRIYFDDPEPMGFYKISSNNDTLYRYDEKENYRKSYSMIRIKKNFHYGKFRIDSTIIFPDLFYDKLFMERSNSEVDEYENREHNNW